MITIIQDKKFSKDPKIIGPGIWWFLHNKASLATTDISKLEFMNDVNNLKKTFPCNECRSHLIEFVKKNPMEPFLKKDKGLFIWTWNFHNNANTITGKPIFPYIDAERMYYSPELCTTTCGHSTPQPPPQQQQPPINFNNITVKLIK